MAAGWCFRVRPIDLLTSSVGEQPLPSRCWWRGSYVGRKARSGLPTAYPRPCGRRALRRGGSGGSQLGAAVCDSARANEHQLLSSDAGAVVVAQLCRRVHRTEERKGKIWEEGEELCVRVEEVFMIAFRSTMHLCG